MLIFAEFFSQNLRLFPDKHDRRLRKQKLQNWGDNAFFLPKSGPQRGRWPYIYIYIYAVELKIRPKIALF